MNIITTAKRWSLEDGLAMLSRGVNWRTAKDGVYLWDLDVIYVEGIACKSAGLRIIFSLDDDDGGLILVSVDVGSELVVLVIIAFWCSGRISKVLVDCVLFNMLKL